MGAQTSSHRGPHAEGVNHAITRRLPPANTRNPLPHCPEPLSSTKSNIRWWCWYDVVPLILEINGRYLDVFASCITCLGVTDTLARRTKLAEAHNPLTQARHHNLAELRIRGWEDVDPSLSKSSGGPPNV